MRSFRLLSLGAVFLLIAAPAGATLITYVATGVVDEINDDELLKVVVIGDLYRARFTVDTAFGGADIRPDPNAGVFVGALTEFSVTLGNHSISGTTDSTTVLVFNDRAFGSGPTRDRVWVGAASTFAPIPPLGGLEVFSVILFGASDDQGLFRDDDSFLSEAEWLGLPQWPRQFALVEFGSDTSSTTQLEIQVTLKVVPEPEMASLLAIAALSYRSRRQARQA